MSFLVSVTNGVLNQARGMALNTLYTVMADPKHFDYSLRFQYVDSELWQVAAKSLASMAANEGINALSSALKKALNGNKPGNKKLAEYRLNLIASNNKDDSNNYGQFKVNNGSNTINALDEWGLKCSESLMLGIPLPSDKKVTITTQTVDETTGNTTSSSIQSDHLVWYDTTALVSANSEKNIVITRVTGRDYSRKELVSNGDIRFSVSGHISSGLPEVYPSAEVQKFRQIMQYKGVVKVNNLIMGQWGVTKIMIQSFSLPTKEGCKSIQDYSFECIGLQPDSEASVTQDTIRVINYTLSKQADSSKTGKWKDMWKNQLDTLTSSALDAGVDSASMASGMLTGLI